MLLDKPQSEAVETILTDCFNAGRESLLKAIYDYMEMMNEKHKIAYCVDFIDWYKENQDDYKMVFKVKEGRQNKYLS